jgi:hypothetical protein
MKKIKVSVCNNLLKTDPWPTHPTNQNYRTWLHWQCDYLFGFQVERRISKSILLRKWLRNIFDIKDDAYETTIFAYNRELDLLVLANNITRSHVKRKAPHHTQKI